MNTTFLGGLTTHTSLLRKMSAIAMLGMREGMDEQAAAVMKPVGTAIGDYDMLEAFLAFAAAIGGRPELARELLALRESNAEQGYLDAVLALGLKCSGDSDADKVLQRLLSLVQDAPTREFVTKVNAALGVAA
jgi:hypothetical protein